MAEEHSSELAKKRCVPCEEGTGRLHGKEEEELLNELGNGWDITEEHHLEKLFKFPDFKNALSFTNLVGEVAEGEGHHPDIYLAWGRVKLMIWTHKVGGLTESDFILAAKCDERFHHLNVVRPCF